MPKLRFSGFEAEYQSLQIGDFANCCAGATPSTNNKAFWENGTVPWLSSGEVNKKRIYSTDTYITQEGYDSCSTKLIPANTVVMALAGQGKTRGNVAITQIELCTNQSLAAIITNSQVDDEYLLYYLETQYDNLRAISSGDGTRGGLNLQIIREYKINTPSLPEQKKIAEFFTILDKRIDKQRGLIDSLILYKRGLFFELYTPAVKRNILFKEIYQRASEGGTPSTTIPEYYIEGKIPFTKIEDLSQRYLFSTKSFITEKGLQNSSAWLIPRNSIIFSNGATIGACSINKIEVSTKQGILGIIPRNDYSSEYLYHYFTSPIFRQKVKSITTKGTMDCAYLKDMDYIKIEVPEYKVQIRIAKILNKIEDEIEKQVSIFQNLQYLKSGLLQQLFI